MSVRKDVVAHSGRAARREDTAQGQATEREDEICVADVGELVGRGSAPTGPHDPVRGTPQVVSLCLILALP